MDRQVQREGISHIFFRETPPHGRQRKAPGFRKKARTRHLEQGLQSLLGCLQTTATGATGLEQSRSRPNPHDSGFWLHLAK